MLQFLSHPKSKMNLKLPAWIRSSRGGEETGGTLGQAWHLLLAELGRAVSVQTLQP